MTEYEKAALAWYIESGRPFEPSWTHEQRARLAVRMLEVTREMLEHQLSKMPPKPIEG